jgi:hypothetical protein
VTRWFFFGVAQFISKSLTQVGALVKDWPMRDVKEWLRDLLEFCWTVLNSWAGYTTGGIIVALVWLWSTISTTPPSRPAGIGLAIFFLIMAFFNAWRKLFHRLLVLQAEITNRDNRTASILIVSHFASKGEYLLHVNPDEGATDQQIAEWKLKVDRWVTETSNVLWAVGRNKLNQFLESDLAEFHGAHKSIWSDLGILRLRIRNLNEIMEKPEIYLTVMGRTA